MCFHFASLRPSARALVGLSTASRIAALRLLLELILKADQVWRSTDLLSSCQAEGARRICERTCASVDELAALTRTFARTHARSHRGTLKVVSGFCRFAASWLRSKSSQTCVNEISKECNGVKRPALVVRGRCSSQAQLATDGRLNLSFQFIHSRRPSVSYINIKILNCSHICSLLATRKGRAEAS